VTVQTTRLWKTVIGHVQLFRSILEMEMALRKFALKHYQDDGVSGSSRGDIVLEKCSPNRFWLNVKEVKGLLRPIIIEIAHAERLGACISDVLPSMGRLFAHYMTCG
jgi:hypothetical protein